MSGLMMYVIVRLDLIIDVTVFFLFFSFSALHAVRDSLMSEVYELRQ